MISMTELLNIPVNWAGTTKGREECLENSCKFKLGKRVCITNNFPENMSHFSSGGKSATVVGRDLATDYGICDYGYYPIYVLHIDGEGKSAWYPEDTLVKLIKG